MKKILLSVAFIAASFTTIAQVGVGTTTPKGALQVTSTTSGVIIPQFADLTAIQAIKKADGTTAIDTEEQGMQVYNIAEKKIYMWNGTAWVTASASAKFVDGTTATDAVFTGGNVGIGITIPETGLHIGEDRGTISLERELSNLGPAISFKKFRLNGAGTRIRVSDGDQIGKINFTGFDGTDTQLGARIMGIAAGIRSATNFGTDLTFSTATEGTNIIEERVRILNNGNVGIGTTTPASGLHIAGNSGYITLEREFATLGGTIDFHKYRLNGSGVRIRPSSGDQLGKLVFQGYDGSTTKIGARIQVTAQGAHSAINSGANIAFSTVEEGTITEAERMIIKDNGNVGIGITNPNYPLDIYHADANIIANYKSGDANSLISFSDNTTTDSPFLGASGNILQFGHLTGGTSLRIHNNTDVKIGGGPAAPGAKLEVYGYIKVGSTDATGNATPTAGMIRYNAGTNKFQGYSLDSNGDGTADDAGWVNLH